MKRLLSILLISFFLITCGKDEDPCEAITCFNNGTCSNGQCDCTERYEGVDCSVQKTPHVLRISKISVKKFPATEDGGSSWDVFPSSGADLYIAIFKGSTLVAQSTHYREDANPAGNNEFTFNTTVELTPKTVYEFWMLDFDGASFDPDVVYAIEFDINDNDMLNFPETINLSNGEISVDFNAEYIF